MIEEKKILLVCNADFNDPSAWSNVPYLFSRELLMKHKNVDVVCVPQLKILRKVFSILQRIVLSIFPLAGRSTWDFSRSATYQLIVTIFIWWKLRAGYSYCICLSYSYFVPKKLSTRVILISDWPLCYHIKNSLQRTPYFFERLAIAREHKALLNADIIVCLFSRVENYLNDQFKIETINLPLPVNHLTNEIYPAVGCRYSCVIIARKAHSDNLHKFLCQVEEIQTLRKNIQIDVIGLTRADISVSYDIKINFHGLLSKHNPADLKIFYTILNRAGVLISLQDQVGGLSSILEGLLYKCQVLCCNSFIKGEINGDQFRYIWVVDVGNLGNTLQRLVLDDDFDIRCEEAHLSVKDRRWSIFCERLLSRLETL